MIDVKLNHPFYEVIDTAGVVVGQYPVTLDGWLAATCHALDMAMEVWNGKKAANDT